MPSSHLILSRPLLLLPPIPPSIRVFSNESTLRMRWPKYWSFSFSIIPSIKLLLSHFSRVRLCATPEIAAHPAPPSPGLSRQEHWSGLPFPPPGDLPNPGIELGYTALQADSLLSEPPGTSLRQVQFSSVAQSCPTLCNPMNHSTPGLPVHHQLPGFTQAHVH